MKRVMILAAAAALAGCADEGRIAAAESAARVATGTAERLAQEVRKLREEVDAAKEVARDEFATVSTDEKGYGVATSKLGQVIVSVGSIAPHMDGYRVKLDVVNLSSVDAVGAKAEVFWGGGNKTVSSPGTFGSGSVGHMDVILAPAKPDEIRQLRVRVSFDSVRYGRPAQ